MREDRSASPNARVGRIQLADARSDRWIRAQLDEFVRLISEWPGLMARADRALIDDCLVLLDHLGAARAVVDVGSGAGLPGIPLKVARPDLELTLIEADQDKAAFLVHACAALGLDHVEVVARRAEEAGHDPSLREAFDTAVARALAPLPALVELCLPLVRVGGRLLAQKTESEDPAPALRAIQMLGGELAGVVAVPSAARATGTIVVIDKLRPTPVRYPRRPGVPARRPL
jgi:16S rRNA (guanine527-N7)-methyltransferase